MRHERIALSTGVTLNVALAGREDAPPIILLHGFPESHRTWRNQMDDLSRDYRVIAPDQRGFAGSDRPEGVENYETDKIVADVMALADALGSAARSPKPSSPRWASTPSSRSCCSAIRTPPNCPRKSGKPTSTNGSSRG
jgi:alpha-beta hydrolase superfamily lysophospholipase